MKKACRFSGTLFWMRRIDFEVSLCYTKTSTTYLHICGIQVSDIRWMDIG